MGKSVNIVGKKYGRLTVIEKTENRRKSTGSVMWKCNCDCGNILEVDTNSLNSGNTQSCGYLHSEISSELCSKDITGLKFGQLTVIEKTNDKKHGNYLWKCLCNCGTECFVRTNDLTTFSVRSCGCLAKLANKTNMKNARKELRYIKGTLIEVIENDTIYSHNKTGVRGVHMSFGNYRAAIGFKGKQYKLGTYKTLEEAKEVRRLAEEKIFGGFLEWYYDNFPKKKKIQHKTVV